MHPFFFFLLCELCPSSLSLPPFLVSSRHVLRPLPPTGEVPTEEHGGQQSRLSGLGLPLTTIIIIVVAAVLLVLLLLDVVCYLRFHWGFLYCLRHSCGGGRAPAKPVADDAKSRCVRATVQLTDGQQEWGSAQRSLQVHYLPEERGWDNALATEKALFWCANSGHVTFT